MCTFAIRAWRRTRRRSRSRANTASTGATPNPRSWSAKKPSMAAPSPPCRPPATPGFPAASAPCSKALCACRPMTSPAPTRPPPNLPTGPPRISSGFGPLLEGFVRVPPNDIQALERAGADRPDVVAVFFETIQGEGGIHPMRIEYLQQVRRLCDERGWLMMIDEVQCGMGRTGQWFAHQWAGIRPDVMPLAKGLGSGVPIGAVVAGTRGGQQPPPGPPRTP